MGLLIILLFGCYRSLWVFNIDGELAQLGERLLCTQEVIGSIPLFSTIIRRKFNLTPLKRREEVRLDFGNLNDI